jgi:hypothetical protein
LIPTLLTLATLIAAEPAAGCFAITVVDEQGGRGVPLVELRTVHGVTFVTDSNGVATIREPTLMDRDVFFHVSSHGYEFPKDGLGQRGKTVRVTAGGTAKLSIRRANIAERLYRVTGADIYRDSVLAGMRVPIKEPLLNGGVVGCDSVVTAVHNGKLYWFWGDTNRLSYPLGNFQVPGATSGLPKRGGLDPDLGVDLSYFLGPKGFAKETARMPGDGPTWLVSLIALADAAGRARLYAGYVKIKPPLKVYARGLAVFDDDRLQFDHVADVDMAAPAFPTGHAFRHGDYVYFAHPFPLTRVRARAEDFQRVGEYECFTPLAEGSRLDEPRFDRDGAGTVRYGWRRNTPAVGPAEEAKLLAADRMKPGEMRWRLRDRDHGKTVIPHGGSVYWNDYRRRWVMVVVEGGGTSYLGEVWYAEADSPTGPWGDAVKVVTHDRYSFYNPKQHPEFAKDGGRIIYFEGTYSNSFSGNPAATPRYDYNQIMYKLDLSDPRLKLPPPPPGLNN